MIPDIYNKHNVYNKELDDCLIEHLEVSFSNMCNQQCLMCNSENSSKWYKFDFNNTNNDFKRDAKKYRKFSDKNLNKIIEILPQLKLLVIKGGEPLIHEEVKIILNYIKKNNLNTYIRIVTNFQEVSEEIMSVISSLKKLNITVSLDSTGERYNWIRGGNWEKTIDNIKKFSKECKFCSLGYANTLNRWSLKHLIDDIEIVENVNHSIFGDKNLNSYYNILPVLGPQYTSPFLISIEERIDFIIKFEQKFGPILKNSIQYKSLTLNHLDTILSLEKQPFEITPKLLEISNMWKNIIDGMRKK